MTKSLYESVQIHGGVSGQYFDINQGPLIDDIINSLLKDAATSALQEDAPIYLGSTGALTATRTLDISSVELPGRVFFLFINNSDISTNNIIISPSGTVNGFVNEIISSNGDYILIHKESGDWRLLSLWSIDEKSNLELELEYKLSNVTNFKQLLYTSGKLTTVNIYSDNTLTTLLFTKSLSYTGANLIQTILTRSSDGATLTKDLTYTGSRLDSVETT